MHRFKRFVTLSSISPFLIVLSACGGGGGGSNPLADAGAAAPQGVSSGGNDSASAGSGGGGSAGSTLPTLWGTPDPAVAVGEGYEFQPVASDPTGARLRFSVENLPGWAVFDPYSGKLSGTPDTADIGTYSNIVIRVSNSMGTASLLPFSIDVTQIGAGSAVVSWIAPDLNTDGSPLTDLSGYRIYFGRKAHKLDRTLEVAGAGVVRVVVDNLSVGPWYFAVSAVNRHGVGSSLSGVGFKRVD